MYVCSPGKDGRMRDGGGGRNDGADGLERFVCLIQAPTPALIGKGGEGLSRHPVYEGTSGEIVLVGSEQCSQAWNGNRM